MAKHLLLIFALFVFIRVSMYVVEASLETHVTIHAGDVIVAEGDSLTYGQDSSDAGQKLSEPFNGSMNPRSISPYPETLQKLLKDQVTVVNHGYPGDRTTEGLARWKNAAPAALTLIMFGTNDCWNFGGYPSGKLNPVEFRNALKELVERRQQNGSQVILLTPPPIYDSSYDRGLLPYRVAVKDVARETGSIVEDTGKDLHSVEQIWTDGVHLSPEANQKIAAAIAEHIRVQ